MSEVFETLMRARDPEVQRSMALNNIFPKSKEVKYPAIRKIAGLPTDLSVELCEGMVVLTDQPPYKTYRAEDSDQVFYSSFIGNSSSKFYHLHADYIICMNVNKREKNPAYDPALIGGPPACFSGSESYRLIVQEDVEGLQVCMDAFQDFVVECVRFGEDTACAQMQRDLKIPNTQPARALDLDSSMPIMEEIFSKDSLPSCRNTSREGFASSILRIEPPTLSELQEKLIAYGKSLFVEKLKFS